MHSRLQFQARCTSLKLARTYGSHNAHNLELYPCVSIHPIHASIWRMSGKIKTWVHVEHQAMQHGYADQAIYEVHQLHTRQQVTAAKESVC